MLRSKQGFTLIEVMVSIAILAAITIGSLQVFIACSSLVETSRNVTLAMTEAESKLEGIRHYDFDSIAASSGTTTLVVPGNYNIYVSNFNPDESAPDINILRVEIVVSWKNRNKSLSSTTLESLIARR